MTSFALFLIVLFIIIFLLPVCIFSVYDALVQSFACGLSDVTTIIIKIRSLDSVGLAPGLRLDYHHSVTGRITIVLFNNTVIWDVTPCDSFMN
jgi:hypothetical protein